jgi:hypothetical protein
VPLFDLKFLEEIAGRSFKSAALALERADLVIGAAEPLGEVAHHVPEDHIEDMRMLIADFAKMIDGESVADDPFVGDNIGRAPTAVQQSHLAEGKPRTERRHSHQAFPIGLAVGSGKA